MPPIRFIHAADLHLDAAFSGLSRDIPADFAERLRTATFTAFRRLLDLCERESPDFLLLAGDVYNQEDASVSAQLALRDGFRRLESLSIPVFLVGRPCAVNASWHSRTGAPDRPCPVLYSAAGNTVV